MDAASHSHSHFTIRPPHPVTKFLLSIGPQTDPKAKGVFRIDHADEAVRGTLITQGGELMWPPPRPAPPAPTAAGEQQKPQSAAEVLPPVEVDPRAAFVKRAAWSTAGAGSLVALGVLGPVDVEFAHMLNTLALSTFLGYHTVSGVSHALHSPLMSGAWAGAWA